MTLMNQSLVQGDVFRRSLPKTEHASRATIILSSHDIVIVILYSYALHSINRAFSSVTSAVCAVLQL